MPVETLDLMGRKVYEEQGHDFCIERFGSVATTERSELRLFVFKTFETQAEMTLDYAERLTEHYQQLFLFYTYLKTAYSANRSEEQDFSVLAREPSEEELLELWDHYLAQHWGELAAQFWGKYVAVLNSNVIDSDDDLSALAIRVYAAQGYRPIFMPYIGEERVYDFTSHF